METPKLSTPVAIIIAGVLIAGAVIFVSNNKNSAQNGVPTPVAQVHDEQISPLSSSDHVQGNIQAAKVVIVEYSDLECPFCKTFHETLVSVTDKYQTGSDVAWVYRHFPLDRHPKAPKEAEASECATELAGNDGFWKFITAVFATTPSNNGMDDGVYNTPKPVPTDASGKPYYDEKKPTSATDAGVLSKIAVQIGLDKAKFEACLASGKYASKVKDQLNDALKAGGNGTPYSILVLKNKIGDAAKKLVQDTNAEVLKQINQPGTPDLLFVTTDGMRVGVSGAMEPTLMTQIIDAILAGK